MKPRHPAPLNALRTFEAAARHLSFNVAARELFVSPAAVSHQVKNLEAYLGVTLFERHHRSVVLTPEGQALAETVAALFSQLENAVDRAMSRTSKELRVTTIESFAAKWLAPRLHGFHRTWPDISVRVVTGDAHADFASGGVDVGIRYGPGGYAGVRAERLLEAQVFPVCAPSLLTDASRPLACPDDLRFHTLLHDESSSGRPGVPAWPQWLQAAGASGVEPRSGPVFASNYLAQEAALSGHGIALGLAPLVEEDLRQGRLVRPFSQGLDNAYGFWLVQRSSEPDPRVSAFCAWLQGEASTPPAPG